ncbi:MAG: DUF3016 domain-containing protein [Methyloglobulus sp.]|nr:DUF3016 domain-containing protein [Methyloglobulus sp.]
MVKQTRSALLLVVGLFISFIAYARVTVQYEHPENYHDLALSGSDTPSMQAEVMKQLEGHLKKLGEGYLPKGDKLEIVVVDIDMAGAYEPWRTPNLTRTRFIRDIYRPKLVLHYRWQDKGGAVKADKDETVSDLNYLMRQETRKYQDNDPLRYEKTLLDRWFPETFAATEKSTP